MDPANIDRRRGLLVGISDASLIVRTMVVAGVVGKIEQRILSTTLQGESTRLIKAPQHWKTEVVGYFSAPFDLLVLSGELNVNGIKLLPMTYLRVEKTSLIKEFSCSTAITALLCADGPLKFNVGVPESSSDVILGNTYSEDEAQTSEFQYCFRLSPINSPRQFWIQRWGRVEDVDSDKWMSRTSPEECFVVKGSVEMSAAVSGSIIRQTYSAGGYYSLPKNVIKQSCETSDSGASLAIYICPFDSRLNVTESI